MLNNHISSTYILISTGAPFSKSLFIYLGQGGRREYYILLGQILKFCHSTTLDETHLLTLFNLLSTFSVSPSEIQAPICLGPKYFTTIYIEKYHKIYHYKGGGLKCVPYLVYSYSSIQSFIHFCLIFCLFFLHPYLLMNVQKMCLPN